LSRELRDTTTNVDTRERGIFKLVREGEIFLHTLKCFLKKGGQFAPESCDIVERIKKVNDEWGRCFFTLELLLLKIKPPCTAEFMCCLGDNDFWINVRRENIVGYTLGSKVSGSSLPFLPFLLLLFFFG